MNILLDKVSKTKNKKGGFTLIELLVVIAIISVLAGLLMTNFIGVRQRGRDAQRKSEMRQIQSALELYRSDNGSYPDTTNFPACGASFSSNGVMYMQTVPCDPLDASQDYHYEASPASCNNTSSICTGYAIYSCLENANDPDADSTAQGACTTSFTLLNP